MFGLAEYLHDRYQTLVDVVIRSNRRLTLRRLRWGALLAVLGSLGYYGGYCFLVLQAVEGNISVGTLTFLAGAIAGANIQLQTVFSLFSSIAETGAFSHRPPDVSGRAPEHPIRAEPDPRSATHPLRDRIPQCFFLLSRLG